MRSTRYKRYKKKKISKVRKLILYGIIIPFLSFIAGYIIILLFIMPALFKLILNH